MTFDQFRDLDRAYQDYARKSAACAERAFTAQTGSTKARNARIAWSRAAEARDAREKWLRAEFEKEPSHA